MKFILLYLASFLAVTNHTLEIVVTLPEDVTGKLHLVIYDNETNFLGEKGDLHIIDTSEIQKNPTI